MLSYLLGVALFALGIALTIGLHEWGHYSAARACGMKVRRFFVGFGPTVFSWRKNGIEYGLKAVPLGGFCDIAGMTAQDPLTPEEEPVAMWKKPAWQRIVVLLGGVVMNVLVALVVLYGSAIAWGLPNNNVDTTAVVGEMACTPARQIDAQTLSTCEGQGPAQRAGIQVGDRILAADATPLASFVELRDYVWTKPGQTVELTVERNGTQMQIPVEVAQVERLDATGAPVQVGAIGVTQAPLQDVYLEYNALTAVGGTLNFAKDMTAATVQGLVQFPAMLPGVVQSIIGGERDEQGPMSVVGASRVGGELVERSMWPMFFLMLASLNLFLALFNLIPLPPLDGGHIAVVLYEKLRDALRRLRGLGPAGPADYTKLTPLTMAVAGVLLAVGVLVIVADVVNPIRLFG
ncbi:M50 family metallopeptidase [Corynebacterium kozikiae]|uniref:M50 family metallopeptidase n=1 Tax=Corynebacterium kozikiae TaxID=2968469 RepID=UPI00211C1CF1|nr:site-2 protease family protein [Corynebacterium sp. 76QC2CO]MCQ9342387.1 site-2 protease family protein [Corynebacterium sp. 76QC2CO]